MKFYFPHVAFTLEDVLDGKINQKNVSESERYILNFVKEWYSDKDQFLFQTSGSTGAPKTITLTRAQLAYSAAATLRFLFPDRQPQRLLLCLDPTRIGGTQVITRALLSGADMVVLPPTADPLAHLSDPIDLVSLVPLQVASSLIHPNPFSLVKNVLIGGADVDHVSLAALKTIASTTFYQTYGMTETASHIALREIHLSVYQPIGDIEFGVDDRSCLKCRGTITNHEWLQTNDVIELSREGFIWKGRADWVINTGGIKIHPEVLEEKIRLHFPDDQFVITSSPDDRLGEHILLVTVNPLLQRLTSSKALSKYELPKEERIVAAIPRLANQKIDRMTVKKILIAE